MWACRYPCSCIWCNMKVNTRDMKVCDSLVHIKVKVRVEQSLSGLDRAWGFQKAEATRFKENWSMKVVRLSALCTGHLYAKGNIHATHFCYRLSIPECHSVAGRIKSMKYSSDNGNWTHDLPACSAMSQPAVPLYVPILVFVLGIIPKQLINWVELWQSSSVSE